MCAILDADRLHEVFGSGNRSEPGTKFYDWLEKHGKLVVGGQLRNELGRSNSFLKWYRQAILSGLATDINDHKVNELTEKLINEGSCESKDAQIIALAQTSNARLLYSNDGDLNSDFQNSNLINNPRGKIYSTLIKDRSGTRPKKFGPSHKKLLSDRRLCRN